MGIRQETWKVTLSCLKSLNERKKRQEKQGIKDLTYFHANAKLETCQHWYRQQPGKNKRWFYEQYGNTCCGPKDSYVLAEINCVSERFYSCYMHFLQTDITKYQTIDYQFTETTNNLKG